MTPSHSQAQGEDQNLWGVANQCGTLLVCPGHAEDHDFLGRVVDLALYETKVLGSKPPPGGLSKNPRLTFVTFAPVSVHLPHTSPYCVLALVVKELLAVYALSRAWSGAFSFLHTRKVLDSRSATALLQSALDGNLRSPQTPCIPCPSYVRRQNSPLNGRCDEDLMGRVSRLWICLPADATESKPRYTN
jgi:hypothetical protein